MAPAGQPVQWTAKEEAILWSAHKAGKSSPEISLLLHNRSAGAVRNRRRRILQENRAPASVSEDENVTKQNEIDKDEHMAQSQDNNGIVDNTDIANSVTSGVDVRDSTDTDAVDGDVIFLSDMCGVTYPVPRISRQWSPDEDARLMYLYRAGYRDQYLADKLRDRTSTECLIRSQLLISANPISFSEPPVETMKLPQYIAPITDYGSQYSSDSDEGRFGNATSVAIASPTPTDTEMSSRKSKQSQRQLEKTPKEESTPAPDLSDRPKRPAFNSAVDKLSKTDWGRGLNNILRPKETTTPPPPPHEANPAQDRRTPLKRAKNGRFKSRGAPPVKKLPAPSTPPPRGVKRRASLMLSDGGSEDAVPDVISHEINIMNLKHVTEQIQQRDKRIAELKKEIETLKKMNLLAEKDIEILALEEQRRSLLRSRSSDDR